VTPLLEGAQRAQMSDRPKPERISRSPNKSAYLFKRQQPLRVYFLSLRIRPRKESLQGRKGGGFEAEKRAEEPPNESKTNESFTVSSTQSREITYRTG